MSRATATRCAPHAFHQPKIHRRWLVFLGCHGKSHQKRPLKPMVSKSYVLRTRMHSTSQKSIACGSYFWGVMGKGGWPVGPGGYGGPLRRSHNGRRIAAPTKMRHRRNSWRSQCMPQAIHAAAPQFIHIPPRRAAQAPSPTTPTETPRRGDSRIARPHRLRIIVIT